MWKLFASLSFLALASASGGAFAQEAAPAAAPEKILPRIAEATGAAGIANITDAEQLFCYEVSAQGTASAPYTLDNMALTGFCGMFPKEIQILIANELLANGDNIAFGSAEQCTIQPKMILRFVRGVDYTDILLSSPCHSFTIFYGGRLKSYNFKPGAETMDGLIAALSKAHQDFVSPALLNQTLPVGVVNTAEDRAKVAGKNAPVRGWENRPAAGSAEVPASGGEAAGAEPKAGGWNNLKM